MKTEESRRIVSPSTRSLRGLKGLLGLLLLSAFAVSGCEHEYKWKEYKIKADRVPAANALSAGTSVALAAGECSDQRQKLGFLGAHRYYGSLRQLNDAIVAQVSKELSHRKVTVTDGAPKKIEITVLNANFTEGSWVLRAEMDVCVKTASGYSRDIHVSNRTPGTVPGSLDGAVALTAIEILNDARIVEYLQQ